MRSSQESPFVRMTPWQRLGVAGILSSFLLWIGFQQLIHPSSLTTMGWVFLALAGNIGLMLVPLVFYQPSYGWFHPLIFGIVFSLLNHLRRADTYIHGLQWHAGLPGWSPDSLTLLLVYELVLRAISLMSWYFGFFLSPPLRLPQLKFGQPRHLGSKVLLVVLFSFVVFAAYMQKRGGITSHILSWGRGRTTELAGEFYWQFVIQFGLLACLSWLILDRNSVLRPLFWGCTLMSVGFMFLSSGSRSSAIYFMILGLIAWLLRERKIQITKIIGITFLGLFLLGILGNFRDSTYDGEINWAALMGAAPNDAVDESALSSGLGEVTNRSSVFAGVFPILALVPNDVDFLYGSSYLAVLTLPVPRGLWPAKPSLIAGMVGETFFNVNVGMPPGSIGEAYWNFGLPGVLMVFFCFGAFCKGLATSFEQYAGEPAVIVLYAIALFLFPEPTGLSAIDLLLKEIPAFLFLWSTGAIAIGPPNRSP
ncbi:oligosaccharide repeat unit polymerase [Geitlerinema splendidum]|nr:oligosaccharide repeat unit polymerase [Geitlerinema splendidum]